jgi:hypothetical protein
MAAIVRRKPLDGTGWSLCRMVGRPTCPNNEWQDRGGLSTRILEVTIGRHLATAFVVPLPVANTSGRPAIGVRATVAAPGGGT